MTRACTPTPLAEATENGGDEHLDVGIALLYHFMTSYVVFLIHRLETKRVDYVAQPQSPRHPRSA